MSPAPVFVRIPGSHHPGIRLRLIPGFRDPGSVLILGQVTQYGNPYLICISKGYEYPSHISKWSVRIYGCESANGDFPCAKLENAKKILQNFFGGRLWKNPELILINMFWPTYMPNLVTFAWKMSSGMSKEAGSLNGPLCTYLMRQNLHYQNRSRS